MSEQNGPAGYTKLVIGYSSSQMMLAILGGAVAGAVVAYLTAPKSGRETRAQLRGMALDARDQVTDLVKDGVEGARQIPVAAKVAGAAARTAFVDKMREGSAV